MAAYSLRKSIHEEMICGMCTNLLKEPKILACAHSFCKDCLTSSYNCKSPSTGLQYEMDLDANDFEKICEEEKYNKIVCPDCLQITVLPGECVIDNLNTHTQLKDVIASLPAEEKQKVRDRMVCRQKLITDIKEGNIALSSDLCPVHNLQHKYYCSDCNSMACTICANEDHAQHQCNETSTLLVNSLSQLQSLVQPACQYASRADVSLKKLHQDSESIESNRSMCKEAIFEIFNQLRRAIDEREKILLTGIDNYIDKKLIQVAQQKKNLEEIQDQLYHSIQEVQQVLDNTLPDISVVTEKQWLIDDTDEQEQNILDIEDFVLKSMFSSTYIGFCNDNTKEIQKQINSLITLCEFFPEADSGYYSSRVIPMESEDNLYIEKKPQCKTGRSNSDTLLNMCPYRKNSTCTKIVEEDEDLILEQRISSSRSLKRSLSTPTVSKQAWLMKQKEMRVPSVPIRFDSLIVPAPILQPESIFDKLSISKSEEVHPCGVCMGENNSIVISDIKNHCLRIISSNGKFIGAIGKEGKGAGQFEDPSAVVINEKLQIFVSQRENPRVQKLTSGGKYIQKFGHKPLRGNSLGEPWGIAIDANKKLFVTDWDKSCIHIFDSNGHYDTSIGSDNSILGESLKFPAGIAVDSSGNLIVSDRGNHCLWVLKTNGNILMKIGSKGHGPGELYFPYGVAIHQNGSIIVSESGNNRISIFSPEGKFIKHFGRRGCEPGMFEYPRHVCVSPKGVIIVADELNKRLQLFKI